MAVRSEDFKRFDPKPKPVPQRATDSETLPYCIWRCRDAREIIVNRKGEPIWERSGPGKPARRADPCERIVGVVDKDYLHPATKYPRNDPITMRRIQNLLASWGVADGCP